MYTILSLFDASQQKPTQFQQQEKHQELYSEKASEQNCCRPDTFIRNRVSLLQTLSLQFSASAVRF